MRRLIWAGILSAAIGCWVTWGMTAPPAPASKDAASVPETWISVGTLKDCPAGTVKAIPEHKIIVFSDPQGIYAVSSECPHKKCIVGVRKRDGMLVCPCHGAKFTFEGAVKNGPATTDLPWLAVSLEEGGKIFVHLDEVVPAGTRLVPKTDK